MSPDIAIDKQNREAVVEHLNNTLADLHMIYTKTRNFHWNVTGMSFHSLHELFEVQYDQLKLQADAIAERARMLGGRAVGTLAEYLERTRLSETPGEYPKAQEMVKQLLDDHETMIGNLREAIESAEDHNDEGTADLLTAEIQMHEEMAWMLRATIE